eukprot:sb/3466271/
MLLLILLSACLAPSLASLSCFGDDGNTPWYTLFKDNNDVKYAYGNKAGKVKKGKYDVIDVRNPLARTLYPLYKGRVNYIMYNDQTPDGRKSDVRGHTKGVLMWDDKDMVWLIHSIPAFPPRGKDSYWYPQSGTRYAQTALCLTMKTKKFLNTAITQLYFAWPFIYDSSVVPKYNKGILADVLAGNHQVVAPFTSIHELKTAKSHFVSYAKTGDWGRDIYKELLAPQLGTSLIANTWQNGVGALASNCTGNYSVWNALSFKILDNEWKSSQDHSKWAISCNGNPKKSEKKFMVCIGGVNRMVKQMERGGMMFCVANKKLWQTLDEKMIGGWGETENVKIWVPFIANNS